METWLLVLIICLVVIFGPGAASALVTLTCFPCLCMAICLSALAQTARPGWVE